MNQRNKFEFSGLGCLYAVWRWLPIALIGLGFWLVREDWAGAVPLGLVSLVAGFAWLGSEFGARRRR